MTDHNDTYARLVEQETLIADATELICQVMQEDGVSRQDLAHRLGKSKGFVSQLLTGERNMTLRTLADVLFALDHRFELAARPLAASRSYPEISPKVRPWAYRVGPMWARPASGDRVRALHEHRDGKTTEIEARLLYYSSLKGYPEPGDPTCGVQAHNLVVLRGGRGSSGSGSLRPHAGGDRPRDSYHLVAS